MAAHHRRHQARRRSDPADHVQNGARMAIERRSQKFLRHALSETVLLGDAGEIVWVVDGAGDGGWSGTITVGGFNPRLRAVTHAPAPSERSNFREGQRPALP